MGGNFFDNITLWTFLCFVILIRTVAAERDLLQDLGLNQYPDVSKINISLHEYTTIMEVYLKARENSADHQSIPKLITFNLERQDWWQNKDSTIRLKFPISKTESQLEVESADLRLLLPPQLDQRKSVEIKLYQILGKRRRKFMDSRLLYLNPNMSKWSEIDVTSAVKSWFDGQRNLGVELVCADCVSSIYPLEAAITALIHPSGRRVRRDAYDQERTTDCEKRSGKKKCCRHNMDVVFDKLKSGFPGMNQIMHPKNYDAGFCQGLCPKNYNPATNHSRIQSLMHQLDVKDIKEKKRNKNFKSWNGKVIPKTCCAPSKLETIDIIRVHPRLPEKLLIEKWDNMKVLECSCS